MEIESNPGNTTQRHEWRDDGKGGIKPVVVTYEVKVRYDAPDTLTPKEERDWNPEIDQHLPQE